MGVTYERAGESTDAADPMAFRNHTCEWCVKVKTLDEETLRIEEVEIEEMEHCRFKHLCDREETACKDYKLLVQKGVLRRSKHVKRYPRDLMEMSKN